MTQAAERPILLIDGNNLAHFLYTNLAPGQKMTAEDSRLLIEHLSSYASTHAGRALIELCLDRPAVFDTPLPENLRVFAAEHPSNGDELLLGRFWFHHLALRPCLVITNDERILEEVREERGNVLRVYDFVRRPGSRPVFRDPQDLPPLPVPAAPPDEVEPHHTLRSSIYVRIVHDRRVAEQTDPAHPKAPPTEPARPKPAHPIAKRRVPAPPNRLPAADKSREHAPAMDLAADASTTEAPVAATSTASEEGPYYFLSMETWPVTETVRFLRNAFCPAHRSQYLDLLEDIHPQSLTPADVRALAELLLHTCGDEPDFTQRGSLMARVRLALLQARGEPLSLAQIARATRQNQAGLQGRIKEKAGRWVVIVQP